MRLLFTLTLLLVTTLSFAQRQNVYFLKNDGRYVTIRDSADYIRMVSEPDSISTLYSVSEFYPNGSRKLAGKSSVIDPPKFEGTCITYYKSGQKQSICNYKSGRLVGDEFNYYPNGKLWLVTKYPGDVQISNNFTNDYLISAEYDSLGTPLVTDGNGYYKGFDDKFKTVVEEGNLKDGKRDGQWKGKDSDSSMSYTETYNNGNLISGTSVGKNGDFVKYTKSRDVEPQYKGGVQAFRNYISRNVKYPDYELKHKIQGKVILSFIIEKDGKVSNIKVLNSVSAAIDNEAIRVLQGSRDWIPGTQYGRKVRVRYSIPLNFSVSGG